jgi:hypothetical protein
MVDWQEKEGGMFQLTVSLNSDLRAFIEERTAAHGLESADDYIEFLLRGEILRLQRDQLEAKLLEALKSEPIEVTPVFWEERRRRLEERLKKECPS